MLLYPVVAWAQAPVPLGDNVDQPLVPSAILTEDVHLSGSLAYFFRTADGADVVHLVGQAQVRVGDVAPQLLTSREAVVWLTDLKDEKRPCTRLEVYLRDEAEVREPGDTVWTGHVLFVTIHTSGKIQVHHDFPTTDSSEDSPVYREGQAVREALRNAAGAVEEPVTSIQVFRPAGADGDKQPEVPALVTYHSKVLTSDIVDNRRIITAIGSVYLYRGKPGSDRFVEIRAEGAVLFLPYVQPSQQPAQPLPEAGAPPPSPPDTIPAPEPGELPIDALTVESDVLGGLAGSGTRVEAAYLEGDVILTSARNTIRASKLYYDFERDKALILDAVVRVELTERNVPLYIRAAEIRQLSARTIEATDARITTSEFHTPHYHLGARKIELVDRTQTDFYGQRRSPRSGTFTLRDATLNVGGAPLLYWPAITGDIDEGETSIRGVSVGYSRSFGAEVQTRWRLFNLLGVETPEGFDASLNLDYFSERGPAFGIDADYKLDNAVGEFKSYLIHDSGEDDLGRGRKNLEPEHELRGRLTWRHREYLPQDWELTFELSYLSDRNFLEEYAEKEFDTDKDQETLLYLKKQVDHWAFTAHLQYRIMDFVTQTERLPDFSFRLVGQPLEPGMTWFSEARAGFVRYRGAETTLRDFLIYGRTHQDSSGTTARAETRQELERPLDIGPWRIVPFVSGRAGAWDDTPEEGGQDRVFGAYGLRGSMYLWRTDDGVRSELWDIDGLRHVIKPDFVVWGSHTNIDSTDLFAFDEDVEGIDEVDGATVGVRQRWQTHRGPPDARRTVDVFTWDVDLGAFNDGEHDEFTNGFASFSRPENSVSRNFLNHSFVWRVNDATSLVNEMNFDLNDAELDVFNLSAVVERSPRLTYLIGYRYIQETQSNLVGFGANYELNEKYMLALREEFDIDRGKTLDFTIGFLRRYPSWNVVVAFNLDEAEDDLGVTMSLAPQGFSGAALGPKRFTGMADSMKITSR
ncbi:MAG: LPS assembly protein LptD [Phycisphaerales bacterium]|nr:LPS assembly protein LptD [Phycisphaerales bacterium]